MIPTRNENPKGLHQKYVIRKVTGIDSITRKLKTKPVDEGSEYFVLRLDSGGSDKNHINACRKAVCHYAELIKDHLPELSKDLIERYSGEV